MGGWQYHGAILAFVLVLVISFAKPAYAATLHFTNGDRLQGDYIAMKEGQHVYFKTRFGQTVEVPWQQIDRLVDDNNKAIIGTKPDTEPVTNKVAQQGQTSETSQDGKTAAGKPLGFDWSGAVNFGAGLRTGNSETNSFNLDYKVTARREKQRFRSNGEFNREEDESEITVDNRKIRFEHDYFYRDSWFTNSSAAFKQDDIADLDLRTTLGFGIGHQAYERDDLNLDYVISADYLRENFENAETDETLAGEWDLNYMQAFYDDLFRLTHDQSLLVPGDDINAYIAGADTAIRLPLREGLIASAEIQYDRDNDPPAGVEKEDLLYALKLGYEW